MNAARETQIEPGKPGYSQGKPGYRQDFAPACQCDNSQQELPFVGRGQSLPKASRPGARGCFPEEVAAPGAQGSPRVSPALSPAGLAADPVSLNRSLWNIEFQTFAPGQGWEEGGGRADCS